MTKVVTRFFRIKGYVQGVGFRYATQREAQRLGLNGWVRNCPDQTVKAEATGSNDMLDVFEQWLHHGPLGAKVEQVESSVVDNNDSSDREVHRTGFEILR